MFSLVSVLLLVSLSDECVVWDLWNETTPMGDELKCLLKEGCGRIFENPLS